VSDIWSNDHILQVGGELEFPTDPDSKFRDLRKQIEPWLSAVCQAEHLALLVGSGFTTAITNLAGGAAANMDSVEFECELADEVIAYAQAAAKGMGRGEANFEDQLSAAMALLTGLKIMDDDRAAGWETAINSALSQFSGSILETERILKGGLSKRSRQGRPTAQEYLISFLMSFASRTPSRERLQIFTTNYDRLIERGCDLAGLRVLDRFIGAIEPEFRSSRLQVDMHYTPPGIRGEPRHLEGVVHLTKLHGSVDWRASGRRICRKAIPFGASPDFPSVPKNPLQSLMIYPNAQKDVETGSFPYADLFRDFSTAVCQPNSVVIAYGYGFGDDHVNRVLIDMLTVPSTHLVVIAWSTSPHDRVAAFFDRCDRPAQVTLLVGRHFGDIQNLVDHYLPKPAIDPLMIRRTQLLERRGPRDRNDEELGALL